jgi:hypothetical protein
VTPLQQTRAREHITTLARANGVIVRKVTRWEKAGAFKASRIVYVPWPIKEPIDYLVSLHELGHILDRASASRAENAANDLAVEMICEAAAWAWAIKHVSPGVVPKMTPDLRALISTCWSSFFAKADFRPNTKRA